MTTEKASQIYNDLHCMMNVKMIVTGSFVLRYLGFYPKEKEIGDIDILVYPTLENNNEIHNIIYSKLHRQNQILDEETYDDHEDLMYKFRYKGEVVNLFVFKPNVLVEPSIVVDGFEMAMPVNILAAKSNYDRKKDNEDILELGFHLDTNTSGSLFLEIIKHLSNAVSGAKPTDNAGEPSYNLW